MKIDLQNRTKPLSGTIDYYWFENKRIGLECTLFHRILIPLEPFDSRLEYIHQPEDTLVYIDWINLNLEDPDQLDGVTLSYLEFEDMEASVYIGAAHNPIDIKKLTLRRISENKYHLEADMFVDFSHEGVAENEDFNIEIEVEFVGEKK